jgi:hypothetical protein
MKRFALRLVSDDAYTEPFNGKKILGKIDHNGVELFIFGVE